MRVCLCVHTGGCALCVCVCVCILVCVCVCTGVVWRVISQHMCLSYETRTRALFSYGPMPHGLTEGLIVMQWVAACRHSQWPCLRLPMQNELSTCPIETHISRRTRCIGIFRLLWWVCLFFPLDVLYLPFVDFKYVVYCVFVWFPTWLSAPKAFRCRIAMLLCCLVFVAKEFWETILKTFVNRKWRHARHTFNNPYRVRFHKALTMCL